MSRACMELELVRELRGMWGKVSDGKGGGGKQLEKASSRQRARSGEADPNGGG